MIEDKTKVNENVEFDTYDGKEDSPKLKLTDKKVESGFGEYGEENGLSPNPDGSGYVKQINATAKPENPEENVLYVINNVKWKWTVEEGWLRVFENPSLKTIDGGRGTPVKENQPPRKRPRVFSEPVAFQDDVFIKGREVGNYNHNIYIGDVVIHLVSSKSTPYSYKEFAEMLYKNGFISSSTALLGSGLSVSSATNTLLITERCGAFSEDGTTIRTLFLRSTASLTSSNRQIRTGDNQMVNVVTSVLFNITPESQQSETTAISSFKDLVL